jgi:hypothetical protein
VIIEHPFPLGLEIGSNPKNRRNVHARPIVLLLMLIPLKGTKLVVREEKQLTEQVNWSTSRPIRSITISGPKKSARRSKKFWKRLCPCVTG